MITQEELYKDSEIMDGFLKELLAISRKYGIYLSGPDDEPNLLFANRMRMASELVGEYSYHINRAGTITIDFS